MKKQIVFLRPWVILCLLSFFIARDVFGVTPPIYPFTIRAQFNGRYDIKMIAAPNLEPVYINPTQAASYIMKVDSVINPQTIMVTNTSLDINNRYNKFPFHLNLILLILHYYYYHIYIKILFYF